jgi:hypothetical protein
MPTAMPTTVVADHLDDLPLRPRRTFRAAWFGQIGAAEPRIARLGATPESVYAHLARAPLAKDPRRLCWDRVDLVGAAIASRAAAGDAAAWRLVDEHHPLLARALEGFTRSDHPAVLVQRFLDDLRRTAIEDDPSLDNIRRYAGDRPLRMWLVDRLLGRHAGEFAGPRTPADARRLRLAIERVELKRERVRAVVGLHDERRVSRLLGEPYQTPGDGRR